MNKGSPSMIRVSDTWLGTPRSLAGVLYYNDLLLEDPSKFSQLYSEDDDEDSEPEDLLIEVVENVGLLKVEGPMISDESWFANLFGIASYPVISRAALKLAEMYSAGEIDQIIHVFSTPGGDAEGINSATEALQAAKAIAPDTISYTASSMLSAGYWLGAINKEIGADKMAQVGSVGAISAVRSIARMLKENGIDAKVYRSGKLKSPFHPYEALSEGVDEYMEKQTSTLHQFFIQHVQDSRPALRTMDTGRWAEGQTVFAEEAKAIGMVDKVTTLNSLLTNFIQNRESKSYSTSNKLGEEDMGKRIVFKSEADRAKVASGVPLDKVAHRVEEIEGEGEQQSVEAISAPTEPTAPEATSAPESNKAPEKPQEGDSGSLTTYLQGEVSRLQRELYGAEKERDSLKEKLTQVEETAGKLSPIVVEATHRLQVALGQTPAQLEGLPATTLAEYYRGVKKSFESAFPVGQHSQEGFQDGREPADLGEQRLYRVK